MNELDRTIDRVLINTVFQPIVSSKDGTVPGYEVISSIPDAPALKKSDILSEEIKRNGKAWELKILYRRKDVQAGTFL